jgi:putative ABC transport system permease protein
MSSLLTDVRQAVRMLGKNPGITAIAVLSLGLAIGATSVAFHLIEAIRWRALPYPDAGRLVVVGEGSASLPRDEASSARLSTYRVWAERLRTIHPLAAHTVMGADVVFPGQPAVLLGGEAVSSNLFELLGVPPSLGRSLVPADDRAGADPVVLISDEVWRTRLGGSAAALGQIVHLSGVSHTIVGVMPPGMRFEYQCDFWIPLTPYAETISAERRAARSGDLSVRLLGRLASGADLSKARAEVAATTPTAPPGQEGWTSFTRSFRSDMLRFWRSSDLAFGAVALVILLVACANVAGLLLVRTISRQREFAIRKALGASPAQISRQLMAEGAVLTGLGGAAGVVLSTWALEVISSQRLAIGMLPTVLASRLGSWTLPIPILITGLTAVLVGLLPARRIARSAPQDFLRGSALAQSGPASRRRLQYLFVATQISGAVVLASIASMGARAYQRFEARDPGTESTRIAYAQFRLPELGRATSAADSYALLGQRLLEIPEVETLGVRFPNPTARRWVGDNSAPVTLTRGEGTAEVSGDGVGAYAVDSGYFAALRARLRQGRTWTREENSSAAPIAVVNEAAAQRWWPGESPVGKRLRFGSASGAGAWWTVVGVVANLRESDPISIVEDFRPTVYFPPGEGLGPWAEIVLRTKGPASAPFIASVRRALAMAAPDRSAVITTRQTLYGYVLGPMRRNVTGILVFAACGFLLAAIGIYGVLAYAVERRRQEIGLRMALGAGRVSVTHLLLRDGLALAVAGLVAGFAAAIGLLRLLQGIFFGGLEVDAPALAAVGLGLIVLTLLAGVVPLRRALRVDPLAALRAE